MRRLLAPVCLLLLAACGSPAGSAAAPSAPAASGVSGPVTVYAAASLTDAFEQLGEEFEAAHPGTAVTFSFGGSPALAQQIVSGAPADVFAAASPATMRTVTDAGDAEAPQVFVRNRLQIAVPPDNPGRITGLADLGRPERTVALCAEQVPCGAAAARAFAAAGVTPAPDTLEQDVKAVLTKVRSGEVDAGLVYRTDVLAAGDAVRGIGFPEADGAVNDYPIAVLPSGPHAEAGRAFVAHVLSEEGQRVLVDAGFERP